MAHEEHSPMPLQYIHLDAHYSKGDALFRAAEMAQEKQYTHIITLEIVEEAAHVLDDMVQLLATVQEKPEALVIGSRDFSQPCSLRMRFERAMSSFWMRVQTGEKIEDMHSSLRAYPLNFFNFAKIQDKNYAFDAEVLVRAAWGAYEICQIPIHMPSKHTWQGPLIKDYAKLITLNVQLTLRALMPLPFKRHNAVREEAISLKHPVQALRKLMHNPYNRATPKELARTAAIAIAVLTVPAPIIQSIALLLFIGWFKLNRLCALAMIPFTWPPFLPAMAILIGYRVRHGHWLSEFTIQTLGYEAGQRLWEWVIGSLLLTPVFALVAGVVVGSLAHVVAKKEK